MGNEVCCCSDSERSFSSRIDWDEEDGDSETKNLLQRLAQQRRDEELRVTRERDNRRDSSQIQFPPPPSSSSSPIVPPSPITKDTSLNDPSPPSSPLPPPSTLVSPSPLPPPTHFSRDKLLLGKYKITRVLADGLFVVKEKKTTSVYIPRGTKQESSLTNRRTTQDGRERDLDKDLTLLASSEKQKKHLSDGGGEEGESGGEVFVAKMVERDKNIGPITPSRLLSLRSDLAKLQGKTHENIQTFCNFKRHKDSVYLFYDYYPDSVMLQGYYEENVLSINAFLSAVCQILTGLEFLHSQNIHHRALCCANILINSFGRIKLFNIQLTPSIIIRKEEENQQPFPSLPHHPFLAPEVINHHQPHTKHSDMWSFGVVILEILLSLEEVVKWRKREGWGGEDEREEGTIGWWEGGWEEQWEGGVLAEVKRRYPSWEGGFVEGVVGEMVVPCLRKDPEGRPSVEELLERLQKLKENFDITKT